MSRTLAGSSKWITLLRSLSIAQKEFTPTSALRQIAVVSFKRPFSQSTLNFFGKIIDLLALTMRSFFDKISTALVALAGKKIKIVEICRHRKTFINKTNILLLGNHRAN